MRILPNSYISLNVYKATLMDIYQEILSNLEYLQILNDFKCQTHTRFYLEVALDYLENTSFIVQYELRDQAAEKKIYFRRNYTVMLKVLRYF